MFPVEVFLHGDDGNALRKQVSGKFAKHRIPLIQKGGADGQLVFADSQGESSVLRFKLLQIPQGAVYALLDNRMVVGVGDDGVMTGDIEFVDKLGQQFKVKTQ